MRTLNVSPHFSFWAEFPFNCSRYLILPESSSKFYTDSSAATKKTDEFALFKNLGVPNLIESSVALFSNQKCGWYFKTESYLCETEIHGNFWSVELASCSYSPLRLSISSRTDKGLENYGKNQLNKLVAAIWEQVSKLCLRMSTFCFALMSHDVHNCIF